MQPKIVEDFVEDMRESKQIPFTRYILADFPWKTQVADDFFWLCGPTLTEFTPWLQMNGRQWDLVSIINAIKANRNGFYRAQNCNISPWVSG